MSMLAAPRQKKRYNLVPKGKALFEDSDRFGTKMLEKMGWSKGKGLGSREDGQQEFVRVRYKNDANGLGFEERDDQWTEHEKHFNGLLENLNGNSSTSDDCEVHPMAVGLGFQLKNAAKEKLKDKISGQSLEEKSKNSKARVHYKKFTKGKDMSQYSEKDLANIFGKKATADDNNIYKQFEAFNAGVNLAEESKEEIVKESPIELGTQIINTGVSVNDYFKMKMAALKEKKGGMVAAVNGKEETENDAEDEGGRSKKRAVDVEDHESSEMPRKKKKNKKQVADVSEKEGESVTEESEITEELSIKKRKKQPEDAELNECVTQEDKSCKKKKRKQPFVITIESDTEDNCEDDLKQEEVKLLNETSLPKKKKSKKHATTNESESALGLEKHTGDEIPLKIRKSKKRSAERALIEDEDCLIIIPGMKKKSKSSTENTSECSSSTQEVVDNFSKTNRMNSEKQNSDSSPTETPFFADQPTAKRPKKNKKKKKYINEPSPVIEVSPHHDLNHLKDNCLLDTYTISTFCAEKFRNIELHQFHGSSIWEINGYGLSENLQLTIKTIKNDQERIMRLWNGTLDKYQHATPKHKLYSAYITKAKQARQTRSRIPKIKMKCLKRKHVFQCL